MSAARGDRKPCTHSGCSGTMQFGREPRPRTAAMITADGAPGWVCSTHASHFQLAGRPASASNASAADHANWDDDGGTTVGDRSGGVGPLRT
jgi:hypothetical protein